MRITICNLLLCICFFGCIDLPKGGTIDKSKTVIEINKIYPELDTMVWMDNVEPVDKVLFVKTKRYLDTVDFLMKAGFEKTMDLTQSKNEVNILMDSVQLNTNKMQGKDSIIFKNYRKLRIAIFVDWMVEHGYHK